MAKGIGPNRKVCAQHMGFQAKLSLNFIIIAACRAQ